MVARRVWGAVVLLLAVAFAGCSESPELVGRVIQEGVAAAGAGAAGSPTPGPPDAGADDARARCLIEASQNRSAWSRFLTAVVAEDCAIPYSWMSTGLPEDVDVEALNAFLQMVQPEPPRPGAVPEEYCIPYGAYPDPADNPVRLKLCEATCNALKATVAADLDRTLALCDSPPGPGDAGP